MMSRPLSVAADWSDAGELGDCRLPVGVISPTINMTAVCSTINSFLLGSEGDALGMQPRGRRRRLQPPARPHLLAPNQPACFYPQYSYAKYNEPAPGNDDVTMINAQSNHPGGVNVGFLDGSVKFIKDSVSLTTWGALATKAGGEIISADQF
jgi:prepilin-type processing-associated H-X9-DG protein